uniref:EF-hand domain-containing protein n=1 Tax=Branchiostoma floridae TaxID=7739 RepID=C3YW01_BRAFL|eukprot:XP_002599443.1 hypothetical protein BRAFLDRAFT_81059 [Branchiostoma floridae]
MSILYLPYSQVLESAGILQNIKRVAGVSAGAITATFVALGLSCADVAQQAEVDMGKILISGGYMQTLIKPLNLYCRYGWETGDGFYKFFGGILEKFTRKDGKPGNPDITFKQLYSMSGIELCIVVTNLDQMTEEYCHVKTTPNFPIRKAVRMSMSIPGLFEPVLTDYHGSKELYVDGGVICNYPLHSFDGWWLSMEEEDSFFSRLDDLAHLSKSMHRSNRFEPVNPKTIGLMLAGNKSLTDKEKKKLFGKEYANNVDQLFDQMDADKDGKLTFQEIHQFFTNRGFRWLTRGMEIKREHVSSLADYTLKYMDLLSFLGKKIYHKVDDMERTIGVDSDYVKTTDFQLEDEDKIHLFKNGATGARAFLRTYIAKNDLKPTRNNAKRRWKSLRHRVLFTSRVKKVPVPETPSTNDG